MRQNIQKKKRANDTQKICMFKLFVYMWCVFPPYNYNVFSVVARGTKKKLQKTFFFRPLLWSFLFFLFVLFSVLMFFVAWFLFLKAATNTKRCVWIHESFVAWKKSIFCFVFTTLFSSRCLFDGFSCHWSPSFPYIRAIKFSRKEKRCFLMWYTNQKNTVLWDKWFLFIVMQWWLCI